MAEPNALTEGFCPQALHEARLHWEEHVNHVALAHEAAKSSGCEELEKGLRLALFALCHLEPEEIGEEAVRRAREVVEEVISDAR